MDAIQVGILALTGCFVLLIVGWPVYRQVTGDGPDGEGAPGEGAPGGSASTRRSGDRHRGESTADSNEQVSPGTIACPICGIENGADYVFCRQCLMKIS